MCRAEQQSAAATGAAGGRRTKFGVCALLKHRSCNEAANDAMDQRRSNWVVCPMSGLPPIAMEEPTLRLGSFAPQADSQEQSLPREDAALDRRIKEHRC
jgi:hypothetical protein